MLAKIVESIGLSLDIVGAAVLAWGLIISKHEALKLGRSYFGGTDEQDLTLPTVKDRLVQSRNAKWGLGLLMLGFAGQLTATWL